MGVFEGSRVGKTEADEIKSTGRWLVFGWIIAGQKRYRYLEIVGGGGNYKDVVVYCYSWKWVRQHVSSKASCWEKVWWRYAGGGKGGEFFDGYGSIEC